MQGPIFSFYELNLLIGTVVWEEEETALCTLKLLKGRWDINKHRDRTSMAELIQLFSTRCPSQRLDFNISLPRLKD